MKERIKQALALARISINWNWNSESFISRWSTESHTFTYDGQSFDVEDKKWKSSNDAYLGLRDVSKGNHALWIRYFETGKAKNSKYHFT